MNISELTTKELIKLAQKIEEEEAITKIYGFYQELVREVQKRNIEKSEKSA